MFFTTDLFSGLVWSFPLNINRKQSPYTIGSLSLSLSLSLKSKTKPSFNPFPSSTLARNKTCKTTESCCPFFSEKILQVFLISCNTTSTSASSTQTSPAGPSAAAAAAWNRQHIIRQHIIGTSTDAWLKQRENKENKKRLRHSKGGQTEGGKSKSKQVATNCLHSFSDKPTIHESAWIPCSGWRGEVEWVNERLDEPDGYWAPKTQLRISEAAEEAGNHSWRSRERARERRLKARREKTSGADRDDDDGDGVSRPQQQQQQQQQRHAAATKFLHPHTALFSLPISIHLPTPRLQSQLRALMDDKLIHHHHHHHHHRHHPHRWDMESIMIQKTAKWKKTTFRQNMDEYIFWKILPSHTHPSIHPQPRLQSQLRALMDDKPTMHHHPHRWDVQNKITIQKDDEMEETTSLRRKCGWII